MIIIHYSLPLPIIYNCLEEEEEEEEEDKVVFIATCHDTSYSYHNNDAQL